MKKLLLVLMVVAMASFLFVGCLGTGIIDDGDDDDGNDTVVQAVTITIEDQYPAAAKEFIRADPLDVTVTFTVAIEEDDLVRFVAKEAGAAVPQTGLEVTLTEVAGSDRKVWEIENYDFNNVGVDPLGLGDLADCADICLYVKVVNCCDPEIEADVYYEIVKLDDTDPCVDLVLTVTPCTGCEDDGAILSWSSVTTDPCDPDFDCCKDGCSGVGDWVVEFEEDICEVVCDYVSGNGCPVEGAFTKCECLEGPGDFTVEVSLKDNVGHEVTDTWTITLDTDELVTAFNSVEGLGTIGIPVDGVSTIDLNYGCCGELPE